MSINSGWILDVYPVADGMCVWVIDAEGRASSHLDSWGPAFYLKAKPSAHALVRSVLESFRVPFSLKIVEKREFFSGIIFPVLEVRVGDILRFQNVVRRLMRLPDITLFNADLNLTQAYLYERNLFSLARVEYEQDADGNIAQWSLRDSPWDLIYDLPPFRFAYLGMESHRHKRQGTFILSLSDELGKGQTYAMDGSEKDMLKSLHRHIAAWDPDIILTDWGDSFIMPRLELYARRCGFPLHLSRDPEKYMGRGRARSFFTYGRIKFRAGDRTLFGRLHIDMENSFTGGHTGLDGLFEVARVAKIPLQRSARCTIGTSLSSIQHNWAIRNDYLIPLDKGQTEDFRLAEDLIASDRGGLVYEPEIGWHEDLVEFDFSSMYPEIMIRHNITPEKINCSCCAWNKVPEINHHICAHEKGMMPQILEPIVRKRQQYKEMIQAHHPLKEQFKRRREAFKWMLVCCFGYLGFRNARFGRIEAHECVNAYSREILLKVKETAEAEGFHFVHAIVDSLWLKKPGVTAAEVEILRQKIEEATGLPLGFEGRYRWIYFCPSKLNRRVGVPTRYVGAFTTGELKVRGIELRRHDAPPFIKALQKKILGIMVEAKNLQELAGLEDKVRDVVDDFRDRLKNGQVSPVDLAISFRLTRDPKDYVHATLSSIAAKKLRAAGIDVRPGELIQYVVAEEHDRVQDWRAAPLAFIEDSFDFDRKYYERLLNRAIEITPFKFAGDVPVPVSRKKISQQLIFDRF